MDRATDSNPILPLTNSRLLPHETHRSVSGSQPCLSVRLQTLSRRRGGDPASAIFHARRILATRFGVTKATIEAVANEDGEAVRSISREESASIAAVSTAAAPSDRVERARAVDGHIATVRTPGDNTKYWKDIPATSPFMTSAQRSAAATSRGESRAPSPYPGVGGV